MEDVQSHIFNDKALDVTEGVMCIDPYRGQVRILVSVDVNAGDYSAAIYCVNLISHTANTRCPYSFSVGERVHLIVKWFFLPAFIAHCYHSRFSMNV